MVDHWYLNSTWNEAIEQAFEKKLRRSRNKAEYLRIQAEQLVQTHPEVASRLYERFLDLPFEQEHSPALAERAKALAALGRLGEAAETYEAALAQEALNPMVLSWARFALPFLIATRCLESRYERAIEILVSSSEEISSHHQGFQWFASSALLLAAIGEDKTARAHARKALDLTRVEDSGMRNHPTLGLVPAGQEPLLARLRRIAGS